jgi:hypothetical protein
MPATAKLALPYPATTDTADVPRDIKALADRLDIVASGAIVSSLPASPADGQEAYYLADATNGIVWHLRYRTAAAGAYKWEVVGGPPLVSQTVIGAQVNTTSGTPVALTGGPSLTVPLAGDYDIDMSAGMFSTGAGVTMYAQLFVAGAVSTQVGALTVSNPAANPPAQFITVGIVGRQAAVAAGAVLEFRYLVSSVSGNYKDRCLRARPIRVG